MRPDSRSVARTPLAAAGNALSAAWRTDGIPGRRLRTGNETGGCIPEIKRGDARNPLPRHGAADRRQIRLAIGAVALAIGMGAHALTPQEAINQAGRQRMLSQRMAKLWCQIGNGVEPDVSQRRLTESATRFESQLRTLSDSAPNPEVAGLYTQLAMRWADYRTQLSGPPAKAGAARLLVTSDEVLALANKATVAWQQAVGSEQAKVINVAGRQRMLSQRMAKLACFRDWGVTDARAEQGIGQARQEFSQALTMLRASPLSTPSIQRTLELAASQWVFFDAALSGEALAATGVDKRKQVALNLATTSERLLEVLDQATGQYEQAAGTLAAK